MRAAKDPEFCDFLLKVGNGDLSVNTAVGEQSVMLPDGLLSPPEGGEAVLATWALDGVMEAGLRCAASNLATTDLDTLRCRALLAPTNAIVDEVNANILKDFPADSIVEYPSVDVIADGTDADYALYPIDFLNSVDLPGLPAHKLRLCPGAVIILLRNLDQGRGLCNGARAVVVQCRKQVLDILLLTGQHAGSRFFVPKIPMSSEATALPFRMQRHQFPVRLAWAMTINKAQGQSFTRVGIILRNPVFAHGQLYVALSRAGAAAGTRVLVQDSDVQGSRRDLPADQAGTYTDNIVYRDVLLRGTSASCPFQRPVAKSHMQHGSV